MIIISPGYSLSSVPSGGEQEKIISFDSLGWSMKLFWDTIM